MTTTPKERYEVRDRLYRIGINFEDANTLRRIAMTLRRWFELECGNGNDSFSYSIERNEETHVPYMVTYYHHGDPKGRRRRIADKETGAYKRLSKLMTRYPDLIHYVQTDCRGASLYILTKEQAGSDALDCIYSRGVAIY